MKVLVIGFPKTGTKTMNAALTELGYNVYDYDRNFYYFRKDWIRILTKGGTKEDLQRMYKDVDACTDVPCSIFWKEMLEAFPDVKLIFTYRTGDEKNWLRSQQNTCRLIDTNYTMKLLGCLSPTARSMFTYSHHMNRITFGSAPERFYQLFSSISPSIVLMLYRKHNTDVLQNAPKEQLLKFSVKDGWEPLCKFLGKEIPKTPFPYKNKLGTVLNDYLRESPVFRRMKLEMMVICSIFVALVAIGLLYYLA